MFRTISLPMLLLALSFTFATSTFGQDAKTKEATHDVFAIAIPILPGKTEQWRQFASDLKTKYKKEFSESRKKLNVRERAFFQATPHGDMVIVVLEGTEPAKAFGQFGAGKDKFTEWFTAQVKELHGVDLRQPPQGRLPEMIIDSK
jgi:hypothetical protein